VHQIITATKLQDKELMYSMKKFYPAVIVMHTDYDRVTIWQSSDVLRKY